MSVNEQMADAKPATVWSVLADAEAYAYWVVGAKEIRGVEGDWPNPGATFHHTQGLGPLPVLKDTSTVLEEEEGRRLRLEVRIRPWLVGHVELQLEEVDARTRVRMIESTKTGLLLPLKPLLDRSFKARNVESLRRLTAEAARRESRPTPSAGRSATSSA
jgi:Polyketide cyclase / dehydrase and lipid transport